MTDGADGEGGRATSAAVSLRASVETRALAALTDEDLAHLAEVMTRVWLRSNRFGWLFAVTPLLGCTAFIVASPARVDIALGAGGIAFMIGSFINTLASRLSLRHLDLEVDTLGYDKAAQGAARDAYATATRSFRFHFGVERKRAACRAALARARSRA
jgi:hypothetical protein